MSVINGVAKKYDGTAIEYVSIFNWESGKCIAQVIPNSSGAWQYNYNKRLNIGVSYIADGCQPLSHGPYYFPAVARYWRISNINARLSADFKGIAILQFLDNSNNNLSKNPAKGFAPHYYDMPSASYTPSNAFDSNKNTWTEIQSGNTNQDWYLAYDFGVETAIASIGVAGRNDLPSGLGREWQKADVEVSDDGVNWIKVGTIEPMIAAENSSLTIKPIIFI